jgi:Peptidase family C25
MKNWLLAILFYPALSFAQPFGNEWIDFNKEYYEIAVAEDAIFKITHSDLQSVGFPVNSVDPRRIQLFHRGVEVAIYIEGQGDAIFDPADFIEFFGEKNDGTLDKDLYVNPGDQPHNYYNLYSDTTAYFLTYNLVASNGKRMSSPAPFTGAIKDSYYFAKKVQLLTDDYSTGLTVSSYTALTQFDIAEGFTGPRITEVANPSFDISITGLDLPVITAPKPSLELLLVGRNGTNHEIEIFVGPDVPGLLSIGTFNFNAYATLKIPYDINWSAISAGGNLLVRVEVLNNGGTQSNISVSYATLNYARQTDVGNLNYLTADVITQVSGGNVIEFLNTPTTSTVYDITDPNNVSRIVDTDVNANSITCGFSDATSPRTLAVATPSTTFTFSKIGFRQLDASLYNYIIISHEVLMKPAGGEPDAVRAYAGYRASVAGGSYDTLVVDIHQLYQQFSYGEVTPLAIYNFMAYMVANGNPAHLLLIGKALDVSFKYHRSDPASFSYHDLVPTAGSPGSDLPFTSGLNGTTFENAVSTGRLSFSSPQEIINYRNKVIEMESLPYDELWRKNVLHLSGGNTLQELDLFKSYVDGFKAVAEDLYLGGRVSTVSKATTATVEFINVSDEVNKGLNLITFFGHSAPNVTDIDIGFVSDPVNGYNNQGRYPMILMNGCNAGNIYDPNYIFGENWIATPNKGATVVIAHTSFGFPFSLKYWSDTFYTVAYADSTFMQKSVGEIQIEVGKRVLDFTGPNPSYNYITQIQQMGLQGDPAVKLFGTNIPDYEINANNVQTISLTNKGITAEADSFAIALGVRNFGAYIDDSLEVYISRRLQSGQIVPYDTVSFAPVKNLDTLVYTIDNKLPGNAGINTFDITLDPAAKIIEHSELNNFVGFNEFIPLSGTINLVPLNFSIQSSQTLDLLAQSGDPLAASRDYLFELDSTFLFTSLFKKSVTQTGKQVVEWPAVSLLPNDSIAYYWRTKYAILNPNEADTWTENSFTLINGSGPGWAQVEYQQMKNNQMKGLAPNEGARKIDFLETLLPIDVTVHGANSVDYSYQDTELIIDGLPFIFPGTFTLCANNGLNLVAFNQSSAAPYAPVLGGQVQAWTCGRSPQVINSYPAGKTLDEILDAITVGDKVLIFTTGTFDFNSLAATTIAKLEELGADAAVLAAKLPAEPYIMLGFKGAGSGNSTAEIIADPASTIPTDEQTLSFSTNVVGIFASGELTSPDIGPALLWNQLTMRVNTQEPSDIYGVDVIGKDFTGIETVLFSNVQTNTLDLSSIDPNIYPFLKLNLSVQDDAAKTAPQLDKWLVAYDPPAEAYLTFLNNSEGGGLNLTLPEGKMVTTTFGFVNITDIQFIDSLRVMYTIFNQDQRTSEKVEFNIAGPDPQDTTFFDVKIDTRSRVGVNNLEVSVNTLIQAEQIYQNNNISLSKYLTVNRDGANPLLEVSFDGEYIFDGDIVSPNPNIHITIRDNNPYLLKTDTTGIDIYITRPCEGCSVERVSLAASDINWTPQGDSEPFSIDYQPQNLADGIYELSVQVEDASGNKSGMEPYVIHFEVINKSTITNFYPYPNPFSTSVKFVFTLTGSEVPDQIMIRIFTVSGRVVREITQDELGPLRIGNNATDYGWDGRDEFGDQLANGVYLYKVFIKKNGQNIEKRDSAGDRGFKNGYGKLYLLR